MRHRGDFEFPRWCARVATALALHIGVGWALGAPGPFDTPVSESADTRLLWLESTVGSQEPAAPVSASGVGEGGGDAEGRAPGARVPPGARSPSPRSPARASHAGAGRVAPHGAASALEPVASRPEPASSLLASARGPAPVEVAAASANGPPARAVLDALDDARLASSGPRATLSSASAVAGPGGGSSAAGGIPGGALPGASGALGRGTSGGSSAHLLGAGNPCADLFPYAALSDSGTVAVALDVATSGQPLGSHIVDEAPAGQGFGAAASRCVRRLRFSPATDDSGHVVASRSVVRLRFQRRGASHPVAL